MPEANTLDRIGDIKLIWDKNKPDEVAAAKTMFDDLKKKRYLAFSVKKDGEKNELLKEWDPDVERLIMAPPLAGG